MMTPTIAEILDPYQTHADLRVNQEPADSSAGGHQSHVEVEDDPEPQPRRRKGSDRVRRWTALTVEAIPLSPKGERRYEADPNTPGLKLRISDTSKVWYAVAWSRRYQRVIRTKLGVFPRLGLSAAREEAADVLDAIERGLDPNEERRREQAEAEAAAEVEAKSAAGTFEIVVDKFVERPKNAKGKPGDAWRAEQRRLLARPELDSWRTRPITSITRDDVEAVVAMIAKKTPVESNRTLATLKALFAWAIKQRLLDSHPAIGVEKQGEEQTRERVLSDREIRQVWKALDSIGHPFGTLAQFSLATACRRGEAAAMRWADVDLEDRLWKLPRTKRGGGDEKPLSALALDLLSRARREGPKGSEFVFQSAREGKLTGFGHAYARAKDLIPDVEDWRPHDLRRTAATNLAKLGVDRFVIERILNHADRSITSVYDRYARLPECRKALDLWAKHLRCLIARKDRGK